MKNTIYVMMFGLGECYIFAVDEREKSIRLNHNHNHNTNPT